MKCYGGTLAALSFLFSSSSVGWKASCILCGGWEEKESSCTLCGWRPRKVSLPPVPRCGSQTQLESMIPEANGNWASDDPVGPLCSEAGLLWRIERTRENMYTSIKTNQHTAHLFFKIKKTTTTKQQPTVITPNNSPTMEETKMKGNSGAPKLVVE